ncbi:hypothetical protein ACFTQL_17625 [Peribacillus butanolivorans]|uniref:hypothetical protein n=1 Tax=Peribacillus butanolivorans TaxID=421767 RepID=UPI0036345157
MESNKKNCVRQIYLILQVQGSIGLKCAEQKNYIHHNNQVLDTVENVSSLQLQVDGNQNESLKAVFSIIRCIEIYPKPFNI